MGSLLGSREATRLMRQQPPHPKPVYHIFNLGFSRYDGLPLQAASSALIPC